MAGCGWLWLAVAAYASYSCLLLAADYAWLLLPPAACLAPAACLSVSDLLETPLVYGYASVYDV